MPVRIARSLALSVHGSSSALVRPRFVPVFATRRTQASFHSSRRRLQDSMSERPTGLKATEGIELLTFGTPNGVKASIILEELKEAYGKDYSWQGNRQLTALEEKYLTVGCSY